MTLWTWWWLFGRVITLITSEPTSNLPMTPKNQDHFQQTIHSFGSVPAKNQDEGCQEGMCIQHKHWPLPPNSIFKTAFNTANSTPWTSSEICSLSYDLPPQRVDVPLLLWVCFLGEKLHRYRRLAFVKHFVSHTPICLILTSFTQIEQTLFSLRTVIGLHVGVLH